MKSGTDSPTANRERPLVTFPADHPRPPVESFTRAVEEGRFEGEAWRRFAAGAGPEPFIPLAAAWLILLHRHAGQEELVTGIASDDGLLAVRLEIRGEMRAGDVPDALRRALREPLPPEPGDPDHPLFRVMFEGRGLAGFPGGTGSGPDRDICEARCDILLRVRDSDAGGLSICLDYDADLFERETVQRILVHYLVVLSHVAESASQRVGSLMLTTRAERDALIEAWSRRETFATPRCMHERFEEQAARTPDAVALVAPGPARAEITYAGLDARANRLAHYLRQQGVGPGKLVGLYVERDAELVVAILAILKAGGAYLPLDLSYPADRLAFMLEDAAAPVIVTQKRLRGNLPAIHARIVDLDEAAEIIAAQPADKPVSGVAPEDLIYSIFTSGSTGKPKGALITHANVSRLFDATARWFHFDASDVWTLFHSCAFDFSVWEMWGALIYGGRLVVVPYLLSRSPEDFHALLAAERVTVLNQTPSAFRQLVRADSARAHPRLEALKWIVFGGEALELQSLAPWFGKYGDARPTLVNMYGITETTVHVTFRPLSARDLAEAPGSVIGEPIADLQLYLLDEAMQPVPDGVPAEIFVGGAGVTRGYLNRDALSAERFIVHPFSSDPAARLYRTGDLARRVGRDDVQYLGRMDQQVKIRGFRIELGEIEAELQRLGSVSECAVLAREEPDGGRSLTAYVVPLSGREVTVGALRDALAQRLPDYMVPAAYVFLDALPLTPHGKLDRAALPEPESHRPELATQFRPPATPAERALADIYKEVLRLDEVGVNDSFFELGGDSLRVGQVLLRLRERFHADLEMVRLFEYPTIRALAEYLNRNAGEDRTLDRVADRGERKRQAMARRRERVKERVT